MRTARPGTPWTPATDGVRLECGHRSLDSRGESSRQATGLSGRRSWGWASGLPKRRSGWGRRGRWQATWAPSPRLVTARRRHCVQNQWAGWAPRGWETLGGFRGGRAAGERIRRRRGAVVPPWGCGGGSARLSSRQRRRRQPRRETQRWWTHGSRLAIIHRATVRSQWRAGCRSLRTEAGVCLAHRIWGAMAELGADAGKKEPCGDYGCNSSTCDGGGSCGAETRLGRTTVGWAGSISVRPGSRVKHAGDADGESEERYGGGGQANTSQGQSMFLRRRRQYCKSSRGSALGDQPWQQQQSRRRSQMDDPISRWTSALLLRYRTASIIVKNRLAAQADRRLNHDAQVLVAVASPH